MGRSDTLELFPPYSLDSNKWYCLFSWLTNDVDPDGAYFKAGAGLFCQLYSIVLTFRLLIFSQKVHDSEFNILVITTCVATERTIWLFHHCKHGSLQKLLGNKSLCTRTGPTIPHTKTRRNVYVHYGKLGQRFLLAWDVFEREEGVRRAQCSIHVTLPVTLTPSDKDGNSFGRTTLLCGYFSISHLDLRGGYPFTHLFIQIHSISPCLDILLVFSGDEMA